MLDGFINLNKAAGMTSHDAVNFVRKIFHTRKVGHGGTLDPMATGILPIAINRATKFIEYLADCDKIYCAEIFFGIETDSGDVTGKIIRQEKIFMPSFDELNFVAKSFVGEIEQTPPKFSAIKINGRKAYDLARKNLNFEMPRRLVKINKFEILRVDKNILTVEIDCAKGTYIRSLAADFGEKLKIPATLKSLQRVRVGNFFIKNSVTLDELKIDGEKFLIPIESCLDFEKFNLPNHRVKAYLNGLPTNIFSDKNKLVKVYADEKFLGVGKIENGALRSAKILNGN